MAINHHGGGTGGSGWTPSLHTIESDTISHYSWQMSRTDTVNSYNFDQGVHSFCGIDDDTEAFVCAGFNYDNTGSTKNSPNVNANFGYTFATAIYVPQFANGNADIVRYEQTAGGGTHFRVGLIGLGTADPGRVFVGRDTSAGYQQDISATNELFTYDQWVHFAWTQANDGLSGKCYTNGVPFFSWSTANAPNSASGTARFGLGASWNTLLYGSYYSTITREKFCSDAEVLAMAEQVGLA
jgi:hypothetical protein